MSVQKHVSRGASLAAVIFASGCFSPAGLIEADVPEMLKEPRVLQDDIHVAKVALGQVGSNDSIDEIVVLTDAQGGRTLALTGRRGAWSMTLAGEARSLASFPRSRWAALTTPVRRGDLDGDGSPEYVWSTMTGDLVVVDGEGNLLWKDAEGKHGAFSLADLDGDGDDEIVVRRRNGSVAVFGDGMWQREFVESSGGEYGVVVADMDGNGDLEIVYPDFWGITIRAADGTQLLRFEPDPIMAAGSITVFLYGLSMQVVPWPPGSSTLLATSCTLPATLKGEEFDPGASPASVTGLAGLAGEITVILDSPYCGPFGGPGGESVIGADGHTYMAMLTNHLGRSTLYFYAADGRLAYNEIIEPRCEGMAVLPGEGGDRLLLGCGDTVWAYTLGTGSGAD